jgi:predicted nucleic acid-binding protein
MISFDTNVLVYASGPPGDTKADRARELMNRAMVAGNAVLILQSLAEFANVALRKSRIPVPAVERLVGSWRSVFPIHAAEPDDLTAALEAVRSAKIGFWDALLWAAAQRSGVRHLFTEDLQDRFILQQVTFINPFRRGNDQLIDRILPLPRS